KQKHTGRARQGSVRSPLWIGGGIVFGPRNERNYSKNLNKKMKRSALFMGLSDKVASKGLVLLDKLELEAAKTKGAFQILKNLDLQQKKVLVVLPLSSDIEKKVKLSFRNLGRVRLIRADSLNIVDILNHEKMIIPVETLAVMEKTYLKK
ncbi:MAG: 50S ribosomal protein L4, partial [Parcubacteria group bacterium]|nr:50S ribosomal protein L4 [Parcubacteria group bacterium]